VTTLVQGESNPYGLAVDATNIYYTTSGTTGGLKKAPIGGGTGTLIATEGASGLAISGTTLFIGALDIQSTPTGGGPLTILAMGQGQPYGMTADSNNVYWVTPNGVVGSVPIAGGTMTTLASNQGSNDSGIAVDASNVYWANSYAGTILSVPITGGGFTTIVTGQTRPSSVAVGGGYVYWTNNANPGSVMKAPVGGGVAPTAIATGQAYPWGIAVDSTYVYWTTIGTNYPSTGTVLKTLR
jgi:hypothetical protein